MTGQPAPHLPPAVPQSDLPLRALSGVVMIVLALGTAWAGGQVFVLFWLLGSFAVYWEWQRLMDAPAYSLRLFTGAGALAITAALASGGLGLYAVATIAVFAIVVGVIGARSALWCGAGFVYAGAILVSVLVLRMSLQNGIAAILWIFAIVWGTDILAYFTGRTFGGPKLWPRVSPSKTWSGFVGGVTGGMAAGTILIMAVLPAVRPHGLMLAAMGLALAIISQMGDLFESAVKRRYGVKDSSNLIPGHGGAMDRLDGFAAAAICAALVGAWRGGPVNVANGLFLW